jgi:hypothetical protein
LGGAGIYWFVASLVGRGDRRLLQSGLYSRWRLFGIVREVVGDGEGGGIFWVCRRPWLMGSMFSCDAFGASRGDMLFLIYLIGTVLDSAAFECFLGIVGLPGIRHLTASVWGAKTTLITACVSAESRFYTKPAEVVL